MKKDTLVRQKYSRKKLYAYIRNKSDLLIYNNVKNRQSIFIEIELFVKQYNRQMKNIGCYPVYR